MSSLWWGGLLTLIVACGAPELEVHASGHRLLIDDVLFNLAVTVPLAVVAFGIARLLAFPHPRNPRRTTSVGLSYGMVGLALGLSFPVASTPIIFGGIGATLGHVAYRKIGHSGARTLAFIVILIGLAAALLGLYGISTWN